MPAITYLDEFIKKLQEATQYHKCSHCGAEAIWPSYRLRNSGESGGSKGPFMQLRPGTRTFNGHGDHHILTPEELETLDVHNYFARWSGDIDRLESLIKEGKTVEEIASILSRTVNAVNAAIYKFDFRKIYVEHQRAKHGT